MPAAYKKEKWASLGIDTDNGFKPLYVVSDQKKDHVKKLKALLKDASELVLATDKDREGEAIAWHLQEVLNPKVPVKRIVFTEVTKEAIQRAIDILPISTTRRWRPRRPAACLTGCLVMRYRRFCGKRCGLDSRPAAYSRWPPGCG